MVRRISRCSLCNNVGHNSRTCVKTNGITSSESNVYHEEHGLSSVQMEQERVKNNVQSQNNNSMNHFGVDVPDQMSINRGKNRYNKAEMKRKRWTEYEQVLFVIGLKSVGFGNWKAIANDYVTTRTPAQLACHAQKFIGRQFSTTVNTKRRRKRSIFDIKFYDLNLTPPQEFPTFDENIEAILSHVPIPTPASSTTASEFCSVKVAEGSNLSKMMKRFPHHFTDPIILMAALRMQEDN